MGCWFSYIEKDCGGKRFLVGKETCGELTPDNEREFFFCHLIKLREGKEVVSVCVCVSEVCFCAPRKLIHCPQKENSTSPLKRSWRFQLFFTLAMHSLYY